MVQSMPSATFDVGQAVSHSRRAEKLLALRSDRNAEGELLIGEAIVAHAQLRTQDGMAVSERAMEIGQALDNSEIWCLAAALHGHFLWASGKLAAGLALMEQAFLRAAQARDLKPRLAAAWLRGFSYLLLWDPVAADRAIQLGLAGSDSTQAEFLRQILVTHAGIAHAFTGALADARSVQALAPHQFLEANIRFSEGEWTKAEALLIQQIERSDAAQSNQQHWTASLWLARLKRIEGEYDRALELLTNTPLIAQQLVRIPEEIATRSELALIHLGREQVAEARSEVLRCRTLLTEHEDWRALGAFVDRAEAAMLAQSGLLEEARGRFMKAGQVFSQYRVPGEVAETLVSWGAQFLRAGKAEEGVEKLDGAIQIYRHLGLGPRWQARVERLRRPVLSISAPPQRGLVQVMPDSTEAIIQPAGVASSTGIYALATTNDVALLATLIHDAIAHLMNAIDRASKLRAPIDRIAEATEKLSKITAPVDRLAHALEQSAHNTASGTSHTTGQPTRPGRSRGHKLNRSHDPGRPL
jgi:tetratricopeptide (TPR) repeat protein